MRVGFDLDGVCYDFAESFREYLKSAGLDKNYQVIEGEPDKWHFYRDWGMTDSEFVKHCHDGADQGIIFGLGEPRENSFEAMAEIRKMGHTVHIITDRSFGSEPSVSVMNTLIWLLKRGYEYDTLDFSADKTCIHTDIFIEDKLENYDALESAGVEVYLVDRPWNQDPGDNRKRINDVWDYVEIIKNKGV